MNKDSETASRFLDGLSSLFKSTNAGNIDEGEILLVEGLLFSYWTTAKSLSKYTMVASGVVSIHMQPVKVHKVTKCLLKPPVKEITILTDLKLHSDMRAIERAEFDHQVAEKMSLFEQYKVERERPLKVKSYCT